MSFGRKSATKPTYGPTRQSVFSESPSAHDDALIQTISVISPAIADKTASENTESVIRSGNYALIRQAVFSTIDVSSALARSYEEVKADIATIIAETVVMENLPVPLSKQRVMGQEILNDMFGVGPIEPLLQDETVSDIMVNGPDQIYVERFGRLELTPLKFIDNAHVISVAQRIASSVGRRVDESSPMVDARLTDGSRVNVILPPLAIDGASISIRKFSRRDLTLKRLASKGCLSSAMAKVLEIAAASRLNVIISGGTGSGKTTLLNALSRFISTAERVITVEDAAELQLQQPHVLRLETRPANLEGAGRVTQGDLVRNALRMRPDRIILGETRGAEALDVLQAMNTGHDGSMTTLHANNPRDALIRLESMVLMANGNLPLYSIRRQIASAVHLIVQVERMRDGSRRIISITELAGMEGDIIVTQDLFRFNYDASAYEDEVTGSFDSSGMRPIFTERARYYGMETALLEAMRP
ncbi:pilus assembly protein CpaF|uniref:Pilus assembly protein CpaF n=1 Tax=Brenneria salicis ATCC 15712 = DSM 30166 TaxID=714314 RepID=A0A366I7V5_9GAMM|nr:CpaF family protein [Brenneria salicis]NMN92758.1 pilus assembly protein CpaF [Brenneria salicis ATCC 15712 = DSM 30166]RBP63735.1 pilus assembly protein CpaF [Brenneria salicis ATCC 15712 = DSM 30166]RLM31020.1 secretion system protein E [Brenneria salicis ATCC 15712 = DSM 30166]